MKRQFILLIALVALSTMAVGQRDHKDVLLTSIDQQWIKPNPEFKRTTPSFFTKGNVRRYFVSSLQVGGEHQAFSWDDNLYGLDFLTTFYRDTIVQEGKNADTIYEGTKILWKNPIEGFLFFNSKTYKSPIKEWHLANTTDCPGTIIFPSLTFQQPIAIAHDSLYEAQGLSILPYNEVFLTTKESPLKLRTSKNINISGTGYDINGDAIVDIFVYIEELNESTSYRRLYLNIDGEWVCRWVEYIENCV
jgi:hypothetical protein